MSWTTPEAIEIKMDAEVSSYQSEDFDPAKDGPPFVGARTSSRSSTPIHGEALAPRTDPSG